MATCSIGEQAPEAGVGIESRHDRRRRLQPLAAVGPGGAGGCLAPAVVADP